ncbi:sialic acid TRAP transporter substrate-binding protein SiaP [Nitratireductor luteus]|uniref:sialic acid TRAP transporter substrate-binding protein SiaP n=1 Tax=Nitratireductor luteus TaxID=2976980 RepID=UPI00223F0B4B|nr:sialic acid TRAP transporter substrate-binding protein SiaP [Nitratireductor luteus]
MKVVNSLLLSGTLSLALLTGGTASAQELTFGMQDVEGDNVYKGVVAMHEKLQELSGSTMSLKLFPGSQLGDFKAMTAQVQEGELDFTINGYPDMSYIIPELSLIGEPYVISDYDHLLRVIEGPYGQAMDEKFNEQGVQVLDVWYFGTRHTTANKVIDSMADMKGLRLRTPNVPFLMDYAQAVGATPAPVAFAEVYLALQTSQVDGQENPLPTIKAMKFYEVQESIALTGHFVASKAVIVSNKTWEKLSEEQRGWVIEAAQAGRAVTNDLMMKDEANLVTFFEEEGLTVTKPDLAPFREAMQPFYDKLEEQFGEGSITELMNQ